MDDWKIALAQAGVELKGTVLDVVERHCDVEIEAAQKRQRERDISLATIAFLELKQNDADIYCLLKRCYKIDSIAEANEYLKNAKISSQIIRLREYMEAKGMSSTQFKAYAKSHSLEVMLQKNPKLLDMTAEKLKIAIDKV